MGDIGSQIVELFTANKWLRWTVFWLGWFWISPTTIIPGAIAVGVGNVIYRERALNLVTIAAAYLGVFAYLILAHVTIPASVSIWMVAAAIFAFIILGMHYPTLGLFLILTICSLMSGGLGGYYRRRRW
jgi:hypothetical protein